jgi:IMP dehydrogenase
MTSSRRPAPLVEGLTFDDVLLVPQRSDLLPREVDVRTRFSKGLPLGIPLASAAMDTVTNWKLAVALAREGGVGIIHRNHSIEAQVREVEKVKRSANGVIRDPVTLPPTATMGEAREIMARHNISGLPIVEGQTVVGILTRRDCRFQSSERTPVAEVMTSKDLVTAPPGTSLEEARQLLFKNKVEKLILAEHDMKLCGLITMKDLDMLEAFPNASLDRGAACAPARRSACTTTSARPAW